MVFSIIIPAYNEERLIGSTVESVGQFLLENFSGGEIIIINDGSTDSTLSVIESLTVKTISKVSLKLLNNDGNCGKGFSVKRGMLAASGDILVFMDADLPFNLDILQNVHEKIMNGFDVVIGNRNDPSSKLEDVHPIRKIAGKIYSAIVQLVISDGITDTQCGLKAFSASSARTIFSRTRIHGFGFDVEVLRIAQKHGLKIVKIPVEMINNRLDSRVHIVKDSLLMIWNIMLIKMRDVLGFYE